MLRRRSKCQLWRSCPSKVLHSTLQPKVAMTQQNISQFCKFAFVDHWHPDLHLFPINKQFAAKSLAGNSYLLRSLPWRKIQSQLYLLELLPMSQWKDTDPRWAQLRWDHIEECSFSGLSPGQSDPEHWPTPADGKEGRGIVAGKVLGRNRKSGAGGGENWKDLAFLTGFWISVYFHFLSDPSPIIGNACHSLTDWLTNWLLFSGLDGCEWYHPLDDVAIATES